jgi:protein SFI1
MAAKVMKVVGRWVNRSVGQAIEAWHEYSVAEARKWNLMKRIAQRLQRRFVVLALELWRLSVADVLQDRAEEERRSAILARVVKHMLHATLASGLLRWHECTQELRGHRMIVRKVALRMRKAVIYKALAMWEENTREVRRQRGVLEKVALRMTNTSIAAAFERWRENLKETRAMEAKTARVVLRWKMQAVVGCLEAWAQLTAEEVKKRNVMKRSAGRLLNRTLSSAIGLWQQNMLTARQEQAEEVRRHNLMSRIAKRMLNRVQSTALERWSENACELARQRAVLDRILKRMLNGKMSALMLLLLKCAPAQPQAACPISARDLERSQVPARSRATKASQKIVLL